jgi:hypothetical protein
MNRRWTPLFLVPTMLLLFVGLGAPFHKGTALPPPMCRKLTRKAGHALNLQRNTRAWFAIARHWSDRHFGPCPQGCH